MFDASERIAEKMDKLIKVESSIMSAIKEHESSQEIDEKYLAQVKERLTHVRKRINKALKFDDSD